MSGGSAVHRAAVEGFGTSSGAYDRGRPGYPRAAIEAVTRIVRTAPAGPVVDLAAGTGIFTRALAESGLLPVAVEPVRAMRERLARSMPGVPAVAATAEALPFADATVGAITVAQAFHWFDGPRALDAIAAATRPGSPLIVVFNVRDPRDPLNERLDEIWEPYRDGTPAHRSGAWRDAFDRQPWFPPLRRASYPHRQRLDVHGLVDRVQSVSFIAIQPQDERARIAERTRALLGDRDEVVLAYRTELWWSHRQP